LRSNKIRISINNLSADINEEELRHEFETYGDVTSVIIMKDKFKGTSKGSAFVEMLRESEGYIAVRNLNGKLLKESAIVVDASRSWASFGNTSRRNSGRAR